jgi:hypothetical protein
MKYFAHASSVWEDTWRRGGELRNVALSQRKQMILCPTCHAEDTHTSPSAQKTEDRGWWGLWAGPGQNLWGTGSFEM